MDGVHRSFGARSYADFRKGIAQMHLDRVRTDEKVARNFLVACASGKKLKNLFFALG